MNDYVRHLSLSVVIPVYNEEENIRPLVERLKSPLAIFPGGGEIIFVDDGSTDATLRELRRAQEDNPSIRVLHFRRNLARRRPSWRASTTRGAKLW